MFINLEQMWKCLWTTDAENDIVKDGWPVIHLKHITLLGLEVHWVGIVRQTGLIRTSHSHIWKPMDNIKKELLKTDRKSVKYKHLSKNTKWMRQIVRVMRECMILYTVYNKPDLALTRKIISLNMTRKAVRFKLIRKVASFNLPQHKLYLKCLYLIQ